MTRSIVAILGLAGACVALAACGAPPDGDDSADDDDSASDDDDDDSGDDDDSAAPPPACVYALAAACADVVVDAPGASGAGFGDPTLAVNGVRGGGLAAGGMDVYSMGLTAGVNDTLVLAWSGRRVVDVPGPDLVVFENPFEITGPDDVFMDLLIVEVSGDDGATWTAFPHEYLGGDAYSSDPAHWEGFAGRTPVLLHEADNPVDPLDVTVAGGDAFDLADLDEHAGGAITHVRLRSAGTEHPVDPVANGPDVDGVYAAELEAAE